MEGIKILEGTIYVWQVFGKENLVPIALPLENGRSRRHPTHFLTESAEYEVVRIKEEEKH